MKRSATGLVNRALGVGISTALLSALLLVGSVHMAQAGINVWTRNGPYNGGPVSALAIDPTTPSTLYAGTLQGVFDIEQVSSVPTPTSPPTNTSGGASVRFSDYYYPVQTGATWLYQGPDSGSSTRVRMANTNYPLTLYNPTAYTQNVLDLDNDYGYLSGSTFVSTENWQDYQSIVNGFAMYGDDDPPDSVRFPMTPFPVDISVGQSETRQGPAYDGAGNLLGNLSFTAQFIEITSVTVPAGTFPDCVHVRTTVTMGGSTQVSDDWWALGVGKVMETNQNDGSLELVSYTLPVSPTVTPSVPTTATATPAQTAGTTVTPTLTPAPCVGDCNGDGTVSISELITMVNIALGNADVSACTAGDQNGDGAIEINEIIGAVNNALNGCGGG